MAVLAALARRPGRLVSRTELLEAIWPGGEVYDDALTQCVYQLRQQLLHAGGDDMYRNLIGTVPKRGYVLKAPVETVASEPASARPNRPRGRRWFLLGALAAVIALLAGWAGLRWHDGNGAAPASAGRHTVAVLPFLPLTEDEREPVLELGMADTLITRLSGIGELVVRPMSSIRRYGDLQRDALEAGRQLAADAVVDGSIQRSGDTLRVAVRLLRVADGTALWAQTINEPYGSIFTVQDEITARIADALALELGRDRRRALAHGGTSSTEAYERYLRGRYHFMRLTPQDMRASFGYFREAVELDPDYTQAWLGLASVSFRIPIAGEAPPREYYPVARQAAERALELDPDSAEAYAMLGWIEHWFAWNWTASEAHFRRAIELNPNDTESHLGYAHLLSNSGRHERAIREVRRARELSPYYPVAAALEGKFLLQAGRADEALRRLQASRQVGKDLWLYHVAIAGAYAAAGRTDEALAGLRRARELSGDSTWAIAMEIGLLVQLDRRQEAEALLETMVRLASERYVPPYDLAVAYNDLGDPDSAMAMLNRAYEARDPKLVFLAAGDWQSLEDRPELRDLLKRTGFRANTQ